MGQNLIMNLNDNGYVVCAYNRTASKTYDFLENAAKDSAVIGVLSIAEMIRRLKRPRRVILMIKAGEAIDRLIDDVGMLMGHGDIIIDGGNSLYSDTTRRMKMLKHSGILYVGCGISGGEEGARYGPSIMPGGSIDAWPVIKEMLQKISAKADDGTPCCDWVGGGGAGHFVKTVHNGIEYGDMQLICEAYHLMRDGLSMGNVEMADTFKQWNGEELDSFLIEITSNILRYPDPAAKDSKSPAYLVEAIRDAAGQKGTGKWAVEAALEVGAPMSLVSEAVFARSLSSLKEERLTASKILLGPTKNPKRSKSSATQNKEQIEATLKDLKYAVYASKIISYAQGFMIFRQAVKTFTWELNSASIAKMWRSGCIIRRYIWRRPFRLCDRSPPACSAFQRLTVMSFDVHA